MKELALTISGVQIDQGNQVNSITNLAGSLGTILVGRVWNILLFALILMAFGYFIFGGIKYVISQGEKKALEEARNTMIYALVGMVVAFLAFLVINLIGYLFGVPLIK